MVYFLEQMSNKERSEYSLIILLIERRVLFNSREKENERERGMISHTINSDHFECLTWSSTSLTCPWTNHHAEQRICLERSLL